MSKVFVNGTAAKYGGGRTILENYLASKADDDTNFYYVFCPFEPLELPLNSKWVKCSTQGISTLLFSLFFCFPFALYYRCSKIISFSNINTFFSVPWIKRVTYFHNMLILKQNSFKYSLLRWLSKYAFQREVQYIFQTSYVESEFRSVIGCRSDYKVMWPGIKCEGLEPNFNYQKSNTNLKFRFLVPIMDVTHPHKNYQLIKSFVKNNTYSDFQYCITSNKVQTSDDERAKLKFLGKLSHDDFLTKISEYDGLLIVSETETLCLPIFEALVRNKPVFVLDRDYIAGLESEFGVIVGLHKFHDFEALVTSVEQSFLEPKSFFRKEYLKGNWDF